MFFAIDLATRRVLHWEVTEHPTREWVTQQARNAVWDGAPQRLIRDRDGKYGAQFDEVFTSSGAEVLKTPPRQPVANAFAERMVLTFRRELFDRVVPRDEEHTRWLLERYVAHFNEQRPHQGIEQRTPAELARDAAERPRDGPVVVTPILNGLIHEYARALRPAA